MVVHVNATLTPMFFLDSSRTSMSKAKVDPKIITTETSQDNKVTKYDICYSSELNNDAVVNNNNRVSYRKGDVSLSDVRVDNRLEFPYDRKKACSEDRSSDSDQNREVKYRNSIASFPISLSEDRTDDQMKQKGNNGGRKKIYNTKTRRLYAKLDKTQRKEIALHKRIVANARERTRVHTLGAAFEKLRQVIPAYSGNQKLSKLAILRLAIIYIAALTDLTVGDKLKHFPRHVNTYTEILNEESKSKGAKRRRRKIITQ